MANGMKMSYHTKNDEQTNNRALSVCSTKRNMNAHPKNQFLSAFCERKYPFYHLQVHIDAQSGWSCSCSCMVWCVLRWVICYALITMNSGKYLLVYLSLLLIFFCNACIVVSFRAHSSLDASQYSMCWVKCWAKPKHMSMLSLTSSHSFDLCSAYISDSNH